jgi:iron-sulfur cluster repair protein YtfE (RIC family)
VPDLNRLFVQLDKFCSHMLTVPGVANNLEIKAQLDFITGSKETLKLALAEGLAHGQVRKQQLNKMQEEAQQKEEAHRQQMEKLNTPSPPLDGDALGRALLKNLGFTR